MLIILHLSVHVWFIRDILANLVSRAGSEVATDYLCGCGWREGICMRPWKARTSIHAVVDRAVEYPYGRKSRDRILMRSQITRPNTHAVANPATEYSCGRAGFCNQTPSSSIIMPLTYEENIILVARLPLFRL